MTFILPVEQLFELDGFSHACIFSNCTYVWEALSLLKEYLRSQGLGRIEVEIPSGAHLENKDLIQIGKGSVIEPGAYLKGPCIIGENCTIRHGAYIRENVLIGNRCVIGHDTEIKHSIFLDDVLAAHFNYIGNSILGNKVNLGAGVKCANLRLDHHPVDVMVGAEKIKTGLKKLGAIIGDGAQVGCNCVINPGTVLGKHSICFPCLNVYGFIPNHAKVKPGTKNIVE